LKPAALYWKDADALWAEALESVAETEIDTPHSEIVGVPEIIPLLLNVRPGGIPGKTGKTLHVRVPFPLAAANCVE
jgi:hypothetical protein